MAAKTGRLSEGGFVDGVFFVLLPDADDEDLGVETPVWEAFVLLHSSQLSIVDLLAVFRLVVIFSSGGGQLGPGLAANWKSLGFFWMLCLVRIRCGVQCAAA